MKIFLKYVVKSMIEKKARFLLLLLAIILSTALFVGSMGAVEAAVESFVKPQLQQLENKDLYISSKTGESTFSLENINEKGVKNLVPQLNVSVVYDSDDLQPLNLSGREEMYIDKSILLINKELKDFDGEKCIISKRISDKFKLNVGDNLKVILNGEKISLKVSAVATNEGAFYMDSKDSFQIIVPYKFISKKLDIEGKYNSITANKSKDSIEDSVKEFNDSNSKFSAKELFDEEQFKSQLSQITSMFYMMLAIVVFMSAIIIYSSFKLTVTERMPIIGTFLSQGATRGTIRRILYLESLVYGILGGIIGNAAGVGILYIINYFISPLREYGIIDKPHIDAKNLVFGMIFSVLLSLLSAVLPVIKTRRLEVKNVILNNPSSVNEIGYGKFVLGLVMLIVVIILNSINRKFVVDISPILMIIAVAAAMLIFPKLVDFLSRGIYIILRKINGSMALSFNNMRTSKVLLGNVNLMILAIVSIITINSLSVNVKVLVSGIYEQLNYSIEINASGTGVVSNLDKIKKVALKTDGVYKDSIQFMYYANGNIKDDTFSVMAVEPDKYTDYDHYIDWQEKSNKDIYDKFKFGASDEVILSRKVAEKTKLALGDTFDMKLRNTTKAYKIAGIVDGKMLNNGIFILMNYKGLPKEYYDSASYSIYFNTSKSSKDIKEVINKEVKGLGGQVRTFEETRDRNIEQNDQLMTILSIFSYMAVVIGCFGILNNIGISFIQRKKDMAVLSSVGMTKGQRGVMIIVESILSVIWAVVIVTPLAYLTSSLMSKITDKIGLPLDIKFNISYMPIVLSVSLILVFLATLPVLFKSRKLSIIEELKYE
jgi:putative ABC transport system permease protein